MAVSLLIITHDNIGASLVDTATSMLGVTPLQIDTISVEKNANPDDILENARSLIKKNTSTLVLTDMYGSTPSNIACHLHEQGITQIISGINLPMLVRVLNYPRLELDGLINKALSGGKDGVLTCKMEHPHND
ncbi:MAG: PTS fructose transporter subunit IIA [Sulfuriflexus sp.]|nr:PTS fructose transporter subunit IIA [Sulfuriflexus sp.]